MSENYFNVLQYAADTGG